MRYKLRDIEYVVTETNDIEVDYDRILELVPVDEGYKERMKKCAIKLHVCREDEVVGLIYIATNEHRADAVSIWSKSIEGMMTLWAHVYVTYGVKQVRVVPHRKEDVLKYVSIATGDSIRRYHQGVMPYILIDFKRLSDKYRHYVETIK